MVYFNNQTQQSTIRGLELVINEPAIQLVNKQNKHGGRTTVRDHGGEYHARDVHGRRNERILIQLNPARSWHCIYVERWGL